MRCRVPIMFLDAVLGIAAILSLGAAITLMRREERKSHTPHAVANEGPIESVVRAPSFEDKKAQAGPERAFFTVRDDAPIGVSLVPMPRTTIVAKQGTRSSTRDELVLYWSRIARPVEAPDDIWRVRTTPLDLLTEDQEIRKPN